MMSSIITGLFSSQGQSAQIGADLENAGFNYSDYVMYLHEKPIKKEIKTSIWRSFFNDKTQLEDDSLVISVKVTDPKEEEKVTEIFKKNKVFHQNYFENIKLQDVKSLEYLKKIVTVRAKALIYSSPAIHHHDPLSGMSSELIFGKER
ncbi:hypothetical protein SAMN05421789_11018 [Kaistella chaponensis]|uniref:Uncharacterized protein n=2 Tax=Kaistella chaponensis TaxID=713588 RepID=A0A1N7MT84_9FLAO|nr:hypothetical protein SAMN05421789_11018 [Kaistella chaponensis]